MCILTYACLLFVIVYMGIVLYKQLRNLCGEYSRQTADHATGAAVLGLLLIFSVIVGEMYGGVVASSTGVSSYDVSFDYAVPIVLLVFSVVNAALAMTEKFLLHRNTEIASPPSLTESFEDME